MQYIEIFIQRNKIDNFVNKIRGILSRDQSVNQGKMVAFLKMIFEFIS